MATGKKKEEIMPMNRLLIGLLIFGIMGLWAPVAAAQGQVNPYRVETLVTGLEVNLTKLEGTLLELDQILTATGREENILKLTAEKIKQIQMVIAYTQDVLVPLPAIQDEQVSAYCQWKTEHIDGYRRSLRTTLENVRQYYFEASDQYLKYHLYGVNDIIVDVIGLMGETIEFLDLTRKEY
jgi:hypothetical protein